MSLTYKLIMGLLVESNSNKRSEVDKNAGKNFNSSKQPCKNFFTHVTPEGALRQVNT